MQAPTTPIATDRVRNVALIGHRGVGKTTLAEAALLAAGVVNRAGSIDEGTTALDRDAESVRRASSTMLGVATLDWKVDTETYRVNLIDTPGHRDFSADAIAALQVADLAVIVVNATSGIDVGTELAWRRCVERDLPRLVFVTREDQQHADFDAVTTELTERFGSGLAQIELPLGEEADFHGVADVIAEEAHEYDGGHHVEPLPDDIAEREHEVHDRVVEEIVAGDDEQLERYLEGEEISPSDLRATLATEVLEAVEFPVLVGSGLNGIGVDRLLDEICRLGPSPAARPTSLDDGSTIDTSGDGDPLLYVFSTSSDQFVGRITRFKVVSGKVRVGVTLADVVAGEREKLPSLFRMCGSELTPVGELGAGEIGAVTKLSHALTGTTLAAREGATAVKAADRPVAHYAVALVPASQTDDDRLPDALHRLVIDDSAYAVSYDPLTRRTVLATQGEAHLSVALSRLGDQYGVNVTTEETRVAYQRTIASPAEAQGRLKKQSGGHGQFAVVDLRVTPLPRGAGFEFVDAVVGGAIPKQYIAAVQHGIADAMASGGSLGIPVVDVRVECLDGKTHSVDSSDMAFRTAAATGFAEALERGGTIVLEPVRRIEVTVPADVQGDVLGDLSSRRGRVVGSDLVGDRQVITADVPEAEMRRYAVDLRSLAHGRGSFEVIETNYEDLPKQIADKVLAEASARD